MPSIYWRLELLEKTKGLSAEEIEKIVKKEIKKEIEKVEQKLKDRDKLFFEIFKDIKRVFENKIGGISFYPEISKKIEQK